jgi:dipeptidyl aminopeptidase/acylaminoacyl peptidase
MQFRLFLLILSCLSSSLFAQEKKPISHEAMWLMKRVGAPSVSATGKWVVFSVTEPSYDEKEQVNDLWIAPMDGSKAPRRLTSTKSGESSYAWSPDGNYLAFTAKRDGDEVPQIYLLNMMESGGEAQRLTKISSGASSPKWSPNGKKLLFNSTVYPQCFQDSTQKKAVDEKKKIKYQVRVYEAFPIREWDKWLDEKQTYCYVQDIHPDSNARCLLTEVSIAKQAGFKFGNATWSPNSEAVIFHATTDAGTGAYQDAVNHLYQISIFGGNAQKLTAEGHSYEGALCSRDGKFLFCSRYQARKHEVYQLAQLVRFDYPSLANETAMTKDLDMAVTSYFAEGENIILTAETAGHERLYTLPIRGGEAKRLDKQTRGSLKSIASAQLAPNLWAGLYESADAPAEVVRIMPDGSIKPLSFFNRDTLAKLDLGGVETFWTTTSRGKQVRSLLIKPAGFDASKKYPLFVLMHGGPASSHMDGWSYRWNYHLLAAAGFVVLATDYTGSTGYGEAFAQAIKGDPFAGPAQEINEAAADAMKRFPYLDANRQAAGGASYGGHLANWMQATSRQYKCLISHAGLMNSISQWGSSDYIWGREVMYGGTPWSDAKIWQEQNPMRYADQFKTPMLITIGEQDFRVPLNNSLESWHIHQRLRIPSKLIVFPEENHWINKAENSRFFYKEVAEWLNKWTK